MELAMVGLGRMGLNMAERLLRGGHRVVGYDPRPDVLAQHESNRGVAARTLAGVVQQTTPPRVV